MLLNVATKIFGSSNGRRIKALSRHIAPINELEPRFEAMSDTELQGQTAAFRQRIANGEPLDNLLHVHPIALGPATRSWVAHTSGMPPRTRSVGYANPSGAA